MQLVAGAGMALSLALICGLEPKPPCPRGGRILLSPLWASFKSKVRSEYSQSNFCESDPLRDLYFALLVFQFLSREQMAAAFD